MNKCKYCSREYEYSRKAGHTKEICNSCHVNRRRKKRKLDAIAYKGGKCVKCGYDEHPTVLEFHHLDPNQKDFTISGNHARKWDLVKEELDKCILLCANCHRLVHAEE